MAAVPKHIASPRHETESRIKQDDAAVVIVGTGPAGVRAAQDLLSLQPRRKVVLYGKEPWEPYNRVRLSSLLAGEIGREAIDNLPRLPKDSALITRYHCAITHIDRETRTVRDERGQLQAYSKLVLATGSRPHLPHIPGIDRPGVFSFRDLADAEHLLARRARTRHTVVLGGGVLGLEVARAMQRSHTEVTVVHHHPRLMSHQLDETASSMLHESLLRLGIHVLLNESISKIAGDRGVESLILRSGRELSCDTLIVSAGIRPNIQLALEAGLSVGRGIRVDDFLRSSDPHIYAVGECAEHRKTVYGLAGPALEQAAVAAHHISGRRARYRGSVAATRLKVVDRKVFSMGEVGDEISAAEATRHGYERPAEGIYRKLVLRRGRLVGALAIGPWDALGRVQESVLRQRRIWPWQRKRFTRTGSLWPAEDGAHISAWPASATVCQCTGVTRGALSVALAGGCRSAADLAAKTGASTVCGSCRPLLAQLAGAASDATAAPRGVRTLLVLALLTLLFSTLSVVISPLPYADSVQVLWARLDAWWRDGLLKQISGYTLITLVALGLLVSVRKRVRRVRYGDYSTWRNLHALLGAGALLLLVLHTGFHFGHNLNLWLMSAFTAIAALGAAAGLSATREHAGAAARAWKARYNSLHLLAAWPLPVLLGFHILSVYYF